ncbi:amino acid transporter [Alphaproteobacteria bacterium KMM 3653]|uniref:Amino acid transporter n=1 Tax=Harenicola maris TaxID=2841044 RepID=A0AAP2CKN4_9RHOB|nr:amino acid transporter [Harenicola maris]
MSTFLSGLGLGLSLIIAIGAQNAFVLRQGILRAHVFAVALTCALSDALLIAAGVGGFGALVEAMPWLLNVFRWGGALFLALYGLRAFLSALRGGAALDTSDQGKGPLWPVLATVLALTWLNPHVYLDTMVLLGSISTSYEPDHWVFGAGAMTGSFLFFFALGYGAQFLRPLFARPRAWQVLDFIIALVMWSIALGLILGG